MSQLLL